MLVVTAIVFSSLLGTANAEVSASDQKCIVAFNRSVRDLATVHGRVVARCLRSFALGSLVVTPEACVASDPTGRLQKTANKAAARIATSCAGGVPGFGVSPLNAAIVSAAIGEIGLLHGSIGDDLDTGLIASQPGANCQSRVATALLKCADTRRRTFLKCQRAGLRNGVIVDATTLAAACLGSGDDPQPEDGKVSQMCGTRLASAIGRHCALADLEQAFPRCDPSGPNDLASCLASGSACQLCQLLNAVDGLARDCDRFDDGNGANGTCGAECGDGVLQSEEGCDDANLADGDGCSGSCRVELGWSCAGAPSVCTLNCGDGNLDEQEECDDGDTASGDGCSDSCEVESGWGCAGEPSVCTPNCGNGVVQAEEGELCDDGDVTSGDGCSASCELEAGWLCTGQPSVCTFVCGNGTFQSGETCDDGDAASGDGCSGVCQIEPGWLCSGQPSNCAPICGDGLVRGAESCDDHNVTSGDGCSFTCATEPGWLCSGQPSNCIPICGDGFIRGLETCDDGDTQSGDGCSGTFCRQEVGWTCLGQPSVCIFNCGDGNLDAQEECDDGDTMGGDGCSATCRGEPGYACAGEPSVCVLTCGNGTLNAGETCDDGNTVSRDGCSASCRNESGWLCAVPGVACQPFEIFIDTPAHGVFTTAGSIAITGHYTTLLPGQVAVTINGAPANSVNQFARTFSHTLALNQTDVFNPVRATVTNTANGDDAHDRIVVIAGQSVADGAFSPQSVAMRVNDSGLDTLEPVVNALAGSQLNLGALLPSGTVLADQCFISVIGCWGSAKVKIGSPAPSYGSLALSLDSKTNAVGADIRVNNLRVDVDIDGSGLVPDCGLRITASQMPLSGDYSLEPAAGSPSNVDVNLAGPIGVSFTNFNYQFTYGICNAPIIGSIIQAFLPNIEQFATDGIRGFLADPDGNGPQDSPIAEAIETTLAGVSISGAIGSGLGLMFDAPLFQVAEDNAGLTLGADARFTVSVGGGPGQCIPPPGAPNFTASYSKPEAFPSFGANTPVGNRPYGLGIGISSAGFNQLLRGQTECGLMRSSLSTIDLDGPGGNPALPLTSTLLSLIAPEFGQLPANTPLRVDIAPTLAPIVTGTAGPAGELTELKVAHVSVEIVEVGPETVWLAGAFDARLGMDLAFLPDGSGMAVTLGAPAVADTAMVIVYNPLGTNEAQLETVLPALIRPLIPELAGALSGFPLPQFFGLSLQGVEVSRNGAFLSLFANFVPAP